MPRFPSPGSLFGSSSPASSVLSRHCDFLPSLRPRFVSFVWPYHGSTHVSLPAPLRGAVSGLGLVTRYPHPGFLRGDDRISQVPGDPRFPSAHVLRPRPVETFQTDYGTLAWPPMSERRRHRRQNAFRGSIAWLSRSPPTYHALVSRRRARLASRCWSGSPGRASTRRVPTKGFNLLHVSYPPLPSFLAQSGLRFVLCKAKYKT